jgi:erythronate-4-phosphate dehydrogenase
MKIVADNKIPFLKGVLEPYAEVAYYPGTEINAKLVNDADALLVRTRTKCNANLLENSKVKFIATATIGFDHIDTAYCESKDIRWTNAPGCNSVSVMQYIASALVFLSEKYNFNYSDKTLGVVGGGNVGSKVALLASGLGMKVLLNDPPRERVEGKGKFVSLQKIQENADIITFHVPLNNEGVDKTYHLVDENFLHSIKPETIIINSSRGEVVSAASLKKALKEKKIKAALLDVWENEPLIDKELLDLVDIGTPHIAGYSADGKAMGTAMSVQALSRFFNFNLNNWLPDNIPQVHNNKIEIDCEELNIQEVINKAVLATYNIENDSTALKKSLKTFEAQRGNYPLRREFNAYEVCLKNDKNNIGQLLSTLGFRIHGRNK